MTAITKEQEECQHNERVWIDDKVDPTRMTKGIGLKSKCMTCGVYGYEIYDYSNFEVDWIQSKEKGN